MVTMEMISDGNHRDDFSNGNHEMWCLDPK